MTQTPASPHQGLSAAQARERLERDGPNELPRPDLRTPLRIALDVVREPMLAMLLGAGGVYLLLGDTAEALILMVFAGFSIAVTIVQEARTENVLEALRDLSAPRALVIRDGETIRVPGRDVVEGDLLLLDQGDRIAADALLIEARELQADESLLTGESVPVRKRPAMSADAEQAEPGGEDRPHVFSGSIITHGDGLARVVATGPRSRIGLIGRSLAALETEAPRLQLETGRIVRICAIGGIGVAVLVVLLYGSLRGGWLDAILAGVAIGMSLLPEEFPVVLTIFLAMGAWRIAQVGVLTRRTAAIETMGAATVLCTDKTGTLTQNRMTVTALWLPSGDTATLTARPDERFSPLLEAGALASAPVPIDPMEVAFHEAARNGSAPAREDRTLVQSHGLRPELLAMSNVWRTNGGEGLLEIAAKGAPEAIANLCGLDPAAQARYEAAARAMAQEGMRVLGVAAARTSPDGVAEDHLAYDFRLLGLVGLSDPLRAGVPQAVAQCADAGIRVVMITGDYAATAQAIAREAGITGGDLMTGDEVAALSDEALAQRIGTVSIFARTMPEQKLRIVTALKAAGEIVAMTGDGVNDAPALKAAHIGIAMGKRGTDVAREASAIVLVEDDFGAIVAAIRVGRRIYDNIRKAMSFIFGVHVPIAGLAVLPLAMGLPVVFGPIQIALLEMIIDPVCALVFEAEREERRLMQRPPRDPRERLFSLPLVLRGIVQGGIAFVLLAGLYLLLATRGASAETLRTLSFFGLVSATLALVLANRSFSTAITHALLRGNRTFRYVLAFIAAGSALILMVPPIQRVLGFTSLSLWELALLPAIGLGLLALFELTKRPLLRP
ncbi:MAG: cation-translocating P-type ATPase [Sphingomonadales bacterium]|nr:cation-translocating P-type ATPase [Sphingomonadales bacterium]